MSQKPFYFYITMHPGRKALHTGITHNLAEKMQEHYIDRVKKRTGDGNTGSYNLLYYEIFSHIDDAIMREREVKRWSHTKRLSLIKKMNPKFRILNKDLMQWPPKLNLN